MCPLYPIPDHRQDRFIPVIRDNHVETLFLKEDPITHYHPYLSHQYFAAKLLRALRFAP